MHITPGILQGWFELFGENDIPHINKTQEIFLPSTCLQKNVVLSSNDISSNKRLLMGIGLTYWHVEALFATQWRIYTKGNMN